MEEVSLQWWQDSSTLLQLEETDKQCHVCAMSLAYRKVSPSYITIMT